MNIATEDNTNNIDYYINNNKNDIIFAEERNNNLEKCVEYLKKELDSA